MQHIRALRRFAYGSHLVARTRYVAPGPLEPGGNPKYKESVADGFSIAGRLARSNPQNLGEDSPVQGQLGL